MSFLQILQPEAGANLITNPSFETSTTGWTSVTSTLARSDVWQYRGAYSMRITPSGNDAGAYFTTPTLTAAAYTFVVHGQFAATVPYLIRFADTSGVTVGTAVTFTGTGDTQRITVTATTTAAAHRLYIQKNNNASSAVFYVDALQLELGNEATTYIDGDQDGCTWAGTPDLSTSIRLGQYAAGGRWLDWTDDLGLDLIEIQGIGMLPVQNVAIPYALLPGAQFQRIIPRSRVITIIGLARGTTWANLHQLRNILIGRVNPDVVVPQQPITFRYTGSGSEMVFHAYYDGGLELGAITGFNERFALRLVAHDPYIYTDDDDGTALSAVTTTNSLGQLSMDGKWSFPTSFSGAVLAIAPLNDGTWVIGGDFVNAGGNANCDYVAIYNPSTGGFTPAGTGTNGIVRAITILDNRPSSLYFVAGGDFTAAGGVADTARIATFRVSTGWASLGTGGANGTVSAMTITGSSILVAAGNFTTIGGVSANRIAQRNIDSGSWSAYGTGLNGACNAVLFYNNTLYAAGAFTTANGVSVNRVTYWNGTTFVSMAGGANGTVNAIVGASNGLIYIGGAFTTAGGATANRIAAWTGSTWSQLGGGIDGTVNALALTPNEQLIVSSNVNILAPFGTSAYGCVAVWDGSTWAPFLHTDFDTNNNTLTGPNVIATRSDGSVCFGASSSGINLLYGIPVTITNQGTAQASPIVINGAYGLYNWTTGRAYYLVRPAAIVDTRQGVQRVIDEAGVFFAGQTVSGSGGLSGVSGGGFISGISQPGVFTSGISKPGLVLRGQLNMMFQSGDNIVSLIGYNGAAGGHMYWRRRHLSADGV